MSCLDATTGEAVHVQRWMATRVTVRVPLHSAGPARPVAPSAADLAAEAAQDAFDIFAEVDRTCTRFDPGSALMRSNSHPDEWHRVPDALYQAIAQARHAHELTGGLFDPRVLRHLVDLGYDRTLAFGSGRVCTPARPDGGPQTASVAKGAWQPGLRAATSEVRIGPQPVDLGGIGKGLAVRWAARALSHRLSSYLVEAGGDMYCSGDAPGGGPWLVAVESPSGTAEPLCVLAVRELAVTTSSVRLRRWRAGGRLVHHLIDPRTGRPGGEGLVSVTVVGEDPALCEVWSKALFLHGAAGVRAEAGRQGLAALWVLADGGAAMTPQMKEHLHWPLP